MPDDVGGQPFKDGEEPDYRQHAGEDDVFASVVLDEDFVRSAEVHEPTAVERILAASQSRAETEQPRGPDEASAHRNRFGDGGDLPDDDEGRFDRSDYAEYIDPGGIDAPGLHGGHGPYGPYGPYESEGPYGRPARSWNPAFDAEHEHGSDYGYAPRAYKPVARRARRPYDGPRGSVPDGTGPYRGHARWQRPIAWVLAVVMGIGLVALAMSTVHRSSAGQREEPSPSPATSAVDSQGRLGAGDGASGAPPSAPARPALR